MTRTPRFLLALLTGLLVAIPALAQDPHWVIGIEELHRLDLLPTFKRSVKVAAITSYDRTGGNDDGFSGKWSFVRKEQDGLVLADLQGPGVLYRFHTPTPTDEIIDFIFDGETTPRISLPFRQMFTGKRSPFFAPLSSSGGGGFYTYVPLPYRKSLKILLHAKSLQFYDLNYATYPDDAPIKTFEPIASGDYLRHFEEAAAVFSSRGESLAEFALPAGTQPKSHPFDTTLKPGQTITLFQSLQPGRIASIRLGPADSFTSKQRDILIRMTWDGDTQPAVLCPVGDFFGYAWGKPAMGGCLVGTRDGVNYCNLPMPFERSAKIELVSLREGGPAVPVRGEIVTGNGPRRSDEGKFYAVWRRENPTTKGTPFTWIDTKGRGHIVGLLLQAQGSESGTTPFFEGDDMTTIDGEMAVHGTGSEDFFNGGWYDVPDRWDGQMSRPLSGCLAYQKPLGRSAAYRFFITDAYPYRQSILQTIEHAPERNELINDYCGVTFLYSENRPTVPFDLPDAARRTVVDLGKITFAAWWSLPIQAFPFQNATLTKQGAKFEGKGDVRFLSLRATGGDFFGPPFVWITCDMPAAGRYTISIEPIKGPEAGKVQLFQAEVPMGEPVDLYAAKPEKGEPVKLGVLDLQDGPNHIMFKIVGKNDASKSLGLDIVNIICQKVD